MPIDVSFWGPERAPGAIVEMDRLKAAQILGDLSMQPVEAELKKAHTELYRAQAGKFAEEAESSRRMAEELARSGLDVGAQPGESMAEFTERLARAAARAGKPDLAGRFANYSSMAAHRDAKMQTQGLRQREIDLKTRIAQMDYTARAVRGTTDDASLLRAVQSFEQLYGTPTGLLDASGNLTTPWSKQLVDQLSTWATSEKDKAIQDSKATRDAIWQQEFQSRQRDRALRRSLDYQRKLAEIRAKARVEKAGGAITPPTRDVVAATNRILREFRYLHTETARSHGVELARRAAELKANNSSLHPEEAIEQAFREMHKRGTFTGATAGGRTPVTALPIPTDGKFTPNVWYVHPTKGPFFFDGKHFRSMADIQGGGGPLPSGTPDDEDEDEDEED